jgi:hypothetical protein
MDSPKELEHVISHGFRSPSEYFNLNVEPYPALYNTLLGADLPRIEEFRKKFINTILE